MFRRAPSATTIWDSCDVECSHCGTRLVRAPSASGAYFSCPRCDRTYASAYDEVLRRNAGARPAAPAPAASKDRDDRFRQVKARLESFLRRLDEDDAWFVLGVPPGTSLEAVHARYRELALVHHPDRGGDAGQMDRIAKAYEAIRTGRASPSPGPAGIGPPPVDDHSIRQVPVPTRNRRSR